jgi:hypothetical protein
MRSDPVSAISEKFCAGVPILKFTKYWPDPSVEPETSGE